MTNYKINIYKHKEINSFLWNDLVENSDESLPFSYYSYNTIFNQNDVYYIVVENEGDIKYFAGISFRIKGKLPILKNFFSLVLLETSVLVDRSIHEKEKIFQIKSVVFKKLLDFSKNIGAAQIFLNHWSRESDNSVLKDNKFRVEENHTSEIVLKGNISDLFQLYNSTCRNTIRKGEKKGVSVVIKRGEEAEPYLESAYTLSNETYLRARAKSNKSSMQVKSLKFLQELFNSLGPNAYLGIAFTPENQPASFAIMLVVNNKMVYYRGGSDKSFNRTYAASNVLIHKFIEFAANNSIELVDMGGIPVAPSSNHPAYGVYKFKRSFGGDIKIYFSGQRILAPLRFWIFDNLLKNKHLISLYNRIKPLS